MASSLCSVPTLTRGTWVRNSLPSLWSPRELSICVTLFGYRQCLLRDMPDHSTASVERVQSHYELVHLLPNTAKGAHKYSMLH